MVVFNNQIPVAIKIHKIYMKYLINKFQTLPPAAVDSRVYTGFIVL